MKAFGILGGTFDPVHIAHLRLAVEAKEQLLLSHVQLMPCHIPPHRGPTRATSEQRLAMLKHATENTTNLQIDDRELKRSGRSYTVDSLQSLREEFSQLPMCLIVGLDAFTEITSWKHWRRLIELSHIVVASRPGVDPQMSSELRTFVKQHQTNAVYELHEQLCGRIYFLQFKELAISASRIRQLRQANREIRFLVPENVYHFIISNELYI